MESLAEILESDLADAVEVKNPRSLHRYITLLTQNLVQKQNNDTEHSEFREAIIRIDTRIEEGFKRMDQRFEAVDRRFEDIQQTMDRRFDDVNKRFDDVNKRFDDVNKRFDDVNKRFAMLLSFMSLGFIILGLLITYFQAAG